MKLTSPQIQYVLDQIEAEVIPDDHPVMAQLEQAFGAHTFFLGNDGLEIVEPIDSVEAGTQAANVVKLASWADEKKTSLAPHTPEPVGLVQLGSDEDPDPAA